MVTKVKKRVREKDSVFTLESRDSLLGKRLNTNFKEIRGYSFQRINVENFSLSNFLFILFTVSIPLLPLGIFLSVLFTPFLFLFFFFLIACISFGLDCRYRNSLLSERKYFVILDLLTLERILLQEIPESDAVRLMNDKQWRKDAVKMLELKRALENVKSSELRASVMEKILDFERDSLDLLASYSNANARHAEREVLSTLSNLKEK